MKNEIKCPGDNTDHYRGRIFTLSNDPEEKAYPNLAAAREPAKRAAVLGETCAIFGLRVPGTSQFAKRASLCALWNRDVDGEVVEVWEPSRKRVGAPGYFAVVTKVEGYDGN